MQTYEVTEAASAAVKMDGNENGVETTQAETETHIHSHTWTAGGIRFKNGFGQWPTCSQHSTVHVPIARNSHRDADMRRLLSLLLSRTVE